MRKKEKRLKRLKRTGPKDRFASKLMSKAFSGPTHAKRWGFTASKKGKTDTSVFYKKFAAKAFLNLLIGEDEVKWKSDRLLVTSRKVRIRADDLREIFDCELTTKQRTRFSLPESYKLRAAYIRSDQPYEERQISVVNKKRHSRKGMVLIKTIAAEFNLHPRDARAILRAEGIQKPEHGWAWRVAADVEKIRKLLKGKK